MSTLRSICLGFGVVSLLGCIPGSQDDEDQPAVPIEVNDAPQTLAEQICANLFECACVNVTAYADMAACVETQAAAIELEINVTLASGGTWNADCAGELAKTWSKWGCEGLEMAVYSSGYDPRVCPITKGIAGPGAECWTTSLGDHCREGLACIDNTCVEGPSFPIPLGGRCEYQWEDLPCEPGTVCDWDDEYIVRTCQPIPQAGDPCQPDSYLCGNSGNDLICEAGTCVAAPGAGEPCFDGFLCGGATYCDGGKDFTCQPRQEIGQGCGADAVCPIDASCISGICTADPAAVCNLVNWP